MAKRPAKKKCACGCGKRFRAGTSKRIYWNKQCRDRVAQSQFRTRNRRAREISELPNMSMRKMTEMRIP